MSNLACHFILYFQFFLFLISFFFSVFLWVTWVFFRILNFDYSIVFLSVPLITFLVVALSIISKLFSPVENIFFLSGCLNIFFFVFSFWIFNSMCLGVGFFGLFCVEIIPLLDSVSFYPLPNLGSFQLFLWILFQFHSLSCLLLKLQRL